MRQGPSVRQGSDRVRQGLEDRPREKIKEAGKQFPGRDARMWCFGFSTWSTREITRAVSYERGNPVSSKNTAGDEVDLLKRADSAVSIWVRSASQSSAAPTLERLPSDTGEEEEDGSEEGGDTGGTHAAPRAAGGARVSSYETALGALACNYM